MANWWNSLEAFPDLTAYKSATKNTLGPFSAERKAQRDAERAAEMALKMQQAQDQLREFIRAQTAMNAFVDSVNSFVASPPPQLSEEAMPLLERMAQIGYRELAKQFHPDTGGSQEKFEALQKAKEQMDAILREARGILGPERT